VLFVEGGRLAVLEMFTYGDPWPDDTSVFSIQRAPKPRDLRELETVEL
jgi:hypothetical protein